MRGDGPLCAPHHALIIIIIMSLISRELHLMSRYLVNARNRAESTKQSRFSPPRVEFCSVGPGRVFDSKFRVSHHATYCERRSLTSYRPVVHNDDVIASDMPFTTLLSAQIAEW